MPLLNGGLLMPRLLSNATEAPLLGEAAMLYTLTQPPAPAFESTASPLRLNDVPGVVWLVMSMQILLDCAILSRSWRRARQLRP